MSSAKHNASAVAENLHKMPVSCVNPTTYPQLQQFAQTKRKRNKSTSFCVLRTTCNARAKIQLAFAFCVKQRNATPLTSKGVLHHPLSLVQGVGWCEVSTIPPVLRKRSGSPNEK